MLMQTKEFSLYFSVCHQEKSIHLTQSSDVKMYVIEEAEVECHHLSSRIGQGNALKEYETQVRQLSSIEILFLIRKSLKLAQKVKIFDYDFSLNEVQSWKS